MEVTLTVLSPGAGRRGRGAIHVDSVVPFHGLLSPARPPVAGHHAEGTSGVLCRHQGNTQAQDSTGHRQVSWGVCVWVCVRVCVVVEVEDGGGGGCFSLS